MNSHTIISIITQLKARGHRLTTARKAIIGIFEANHRPISAEQVNELLITDNININKSTLYREIDFLITQNIIKHIQLQEKTKRYELIHLHHHHHLICQKCHKIENFDIENCIEDVLSKVTAEHSFLINEHILDIYGICKQCQTATKL
jgi:Fur family transcriptional regulator, ferric uptake regulator